MPTRPRFAIRIEPGEGYSELSSFARVIERFGELLYEIEKTIDPTRKKTIPWVVSGLSEGSYVVVVEPTTEIDLGMKVLRSTISGLRQLENMQIPHDLYSLRALNIVREIALETNRQKGRITVQTDELMAVIGPSTLVTIDEVFVPPRFQDYGGVEGTIESISIRIRPMCSLYRNVDFKRISCYFEEELLPTITRSLEKKQRVAVYGPIAYGEDGDVKSIRAESIDMLPRDEDLPHPAHFLGFVPGFSDGLKSEDFIRQHRKERQVGDKGKIG